MTAPLLHLRIAAMWLGLGTQRPLFQRYAVARLTPAARASRAMAPWPETPRNSTSVMTPILHNTHITSSAELAHCAREPSPAQCDSRDMRNRIREVRKSRGLTLEQLAERLGGKTDASVVGRLETEKIPLTMEWLDRIAKALDSPIGELISIDYVKPKKAKVVGYVGVGEKYYPDPRAGAWMAIGEIEAPPGAGDKVVALEVRDDSMGPVYRIGDFVYFDYGGAQLADCVGQDCVIQVRGGDAYIKLALEGSRPGTLTLRSYTKGVPDLRDQEVLWAAPVLWVRRSPRR